MKIEGSSNQSNATRGRESEQIRGEEENASLLNQLLASVSEKESRKLGVKFNRLFDKIQRLYPNFQSDALLDFQIDDRLTSGESVKAQPMYRVVHFLYTTAKDQRVKDILRGRSMSADGSKVGKNLDCASSLGDMVKSENEKVNLQSENVLLRHQADNLFQEIELYKRKLALIQDSLDDQEEQRENQVDLMAQEITRLRNEQEEFHSQISLLLAQNQGLSEMVQKLRSDQQSHQVSFRVAGPQIIRQSISPNRMELPQQFSGDKVQNADENWLQSELRDLRHKLKLEEEKNGQLREKNYDLSQRLGQSQQSFEQDRKMLDELVAKLRQDLLYKDSSLKMQEQTISQFCLSTKIEFPILVPHSTHSRKEDTQQQQQSDMMSKPKFVSMTKRAQMSSLEQEEIEIEMALNCNLPFAEVFAEDMKERGMQTLKQPLKKSKDQPNLRQRQMQLVDKQPNRKGQIKEMGSMVSLQTAVQSQISAALIADQILIEHRKARKEKLVQVEEALDKYRLTDQQLKRLEGEKEKMYEEVERMSRENEGLKVKFSQLLDQFQEYVNESERKIEEDHINQKQEQDRLFGELNQTIRDLEEMSHSLQTDCEAKFKRIQQLELDKDQLQADLEELRKNKESEERHQEELFRSRVKALTEELEFIRKQHAYDIELIRHRNKAPNCQEQVRNSQIQNGYDAQDPQSPHYFNVENQRESMLIRSGNFGNSEQDKQFGQGLIIGSSSQPSNSFEAVKRNQGDQDDYNGVRQQARGERSLDRGSLYSRGRQLGEKIIIQPRDTHSNEVERCSYQNDQSSQGNNSFFRLRDNSQKSAQKSQVHQDRSQDGRSLNQNRQNSLFAREDHGSGMDIRYQKARQSHESQYVFGRESLENLKRDMADRDKLIEQKNREIIRLRLELDELRNTPSESDSAVTPLLRKDLIIEFDESLSILKSEITRVRLSMGLEQEMTQWKGEEWGCQMRTESQLVRAVRERLKQMRDVKNMAQELCLVANKNKYQRQEDGRGSKVVEELREDNALLQRQMFKYETTLNQLDKIFRRQDSKDDIIFQLKKLTDEQLRELTRMQEEVEQMRRRLIEREEQESGGEVDALKQEVVMLREQMARVKRGSQEADLGVQTRKELEEQLNDIRHRITVIAELFEKKPIKQRYSFEVLCDFIHDKAKRLFAKYETALKEKKGLKDELKIKVGTRRGEGNEEMEDFISYLNSNVVTPLARMVGQQGQIINSSFDQNLLGQLVEDVEEKMRKLKANLQITEENLRQTQMRVGELQGGQRGRSQRGDGEELGDLRYEKEKLNGKLEEFSAILRQFEENQRYLVEDNSQLRSKISQLENQRLVPNELQSSSLNTFQSGSYPKSRQEANRDWFKIPTRSVSIQNQKMSNYPSQGKIVCSSSKGGRVESAEMGGDYEQRSDYQGEIVELNQRQHLAQDVFQQLRGSQQTDGSQRTRGLKGDCEVEG